MDNASRVRDPSVADICLICPKGTNHTVCPFGRTPSSQRHVKFHVAASARCEAAKRPVYWEIASSQRARALLATTYGDWGDCLPSARFAVVATNAPRNDIHEQHVIASASREAIFQLMKYSKLRGDCLPRARCAVVGTNAPRNDKL